MSLSQDMNTILRIGMEGAKPPLCSLACSSGISQLASGCCNSKDNRSARKRAPGTKSHIVQG